MVTQPTDRTRVRERDGQGAAGWRALAARWYIRVYILHAGVLVLCVGLVVWPGAVLSALPGQAHADKVPLLVAQCTKGDNASCKTLLSADHLDDAYAAAATGPSRLLRHLAANAQVPTSITFLRMATHRFPRDAQSHYALGVAILNTGRNKAPADLEAYGPLLRAVELQPDYVEALLVLAGIELDSGRPDLAAQRYRAVLQAQPSRVSTKAALGKALLAFGHPREAADEFREALGGRGLSTVDVDVARAGFGEALFWLGDGAAALDALQQNTATGGVPGPGVACITAVTLWWSGRDDEATRACVNTLEGDLFCNCHGRASGTTAQPPALTVEDVAVVRAALAQNPALGLTGERVAVVEGTTAFSDVNLPGVVTLRRPFLDLTRQYEDSARVAEAVEDLLGRSRTPALVESLGTDRTPVRAIGRAEMRNVITERVPFQDRFPTSRGFLTISRPGFSRDHSVAALAVQHNADLWNGPVHLFVFDRHRETWTLRQNAETRR